MMESIESTTCTAIPKANDTTRSPSAPKGKTNKRKSSSLPSNTVEYLKAWMMSPEHIAHPYPTEQEKAQIMADTGIELKQLTNWFVNNRKRYWKPRVEARLQQQAQAAAAAAQAHAAAVAAVTVAAQANPVTPDVGYNKPTLNVQPSLANFVAFEGGRTSKPATMTILGSDLASILSGGKSVAAVSEASSSASVSASEGYSTESPSEDESSNDDISGEQHTEMERPSSPEPVCIETKETLQVEIPPKQEIEVNEKKRIIETEVCTQEPRRKFRRVSLESWREACENATNMNDEELPSLEEATRLFGYSR